MRSALSLAGINSSTIFPDLTGAAKHIEWLASQGFKKTFIIH